MPYDHLNHYVPPITEGISDAWRRTLSRLGDYTAIIVRALNLRPLAVSLHAQTEAHLLVRIVTPGEYLILRVAPEDDLAAHCYFLRGLSGQRLPTAQLIQRDLLCKLVPFAFTIESYVPGQAPCADLPDTLLRGIGRQAGRALRKMHRAAVPSAGRPLPSGRWPAQSWRGVLEAIGRQLAPPPSDALIFGAAERAAVAALLDDPRLDCRQPGLIHGAFGPRAIRCTTTEHINLEAFVQPGRWVGGDGLYDLACGLSPAHPAAWCEGLLEGYTAVSPLSPAEHERLPLLRMLACYWGACYHYMRAEPHEAEREEALSLLVDLGRTGEARCAPAAPPIPHGDTAARSTR